MSDSLTQALSNPGPHTAESLAARLPAFPLEAIRAALEALAAQGVLARESEEGGSPHYRLVAPELYAQVNLDVIQNPGGGPNRRR